MPKIIFFDTETTGNEQKDFLCQIAYKTDGEEFTGLYNPPLKIPPEASAVHHITNKMVADKLSFQESGVRVFTLMVAAVTVMLAGCGEDPPARRVEGGDARAGKRLLELYQCGACHAIPGTAMAQGSAGPPLAAFGRRSYIAGSIPNQAPALVRWIVNPPAAKPGTTMPNLGVSESEARHMAAYLYSLQ